MAVPKCCIAAQLSHVFPNSLNLRHVGMTHTGMAEYPSSV